MRPLSPLPLCSLLLLLSHVTPAHADPTAAAEHYKKGMAAYALEDWDAAIAEFDKGFRQEPKPEFLYNIAQAHRQAGRHEQAMRFYQRYLDLKPDAADRAEVERLIRVLRHSVSEKQRATAAPPVGIDGAPARAPQPEAVVPETGPAPTPRADSPRQDVTAIGLLASGAAVAAAGIGLAAYGSVAAGKSTDRTAPLDLGERESLLARADAMSVTGYVAIGVGAALLAGGAVKLVLGPKSAVSFGVGAAPGSVSCALAGTF